MNTPTDDESDLRYAEYVLGVLDADARAAVEQELAASPQAAAAEAQWRQRLLPLAEAAGTETPPPQLWTRIRAALEFDAPAAAADARGGWWQNIRLWHWLTFGSGALLAAACAALVVIATHRPPSPPIPYMAATIMETDGRVGWTATMDISKARMIVVPGAPQPVRADHTPELWLIPRGARPVAVGLISTHAPMTLTLSASLVARLGPTARLAVTIEPRGGSPTGQPTGPLVAAGMIGAAPASALHLAHTPQRRA